MFSQNNGKRYRIVIPFDPALGKTDYTLPVGTRAQRRDSSEGRLHRNVAKMIAQNAPQVDVERYLRIEGLEPINVDQTISRILVETGRADFWKAQVGRVLGWLLFVLLVVRPANGRRLLDGMDLVRQKGGVFSCRRRRLIVRSTPGAFKEARLSSILACGNAFSLTFFWGTL